ncbi:MAG TPA: carbon storage regulator CsrA [Pseudogracilibacillus sp.]|nr:carbon storage regulator CsrA [Pseudogracilibacillus sp.]
MLVLTRKTKEAIKIGDDIEIKVLAVQGDQVKIGIKAPRSVEVHRKELIEDVQLQNNEAANIPADYLVKLNQLYDNKKN